MPFPPPPPQADAQAQPQQPTAAQIALHAAELYALERAAARAIAAPLRSRLIRIQRNAAAAWIRAFGSLSASADPIRLGQVVADIQRDLADITPDASTSLDTWAQRALDLGIRQGAREVGVGTAHVDAAPDDRTLRTIAGADLRIGGRIADADAALNIAGPAFDDITQALAHAHRAATDMQGAVVQAVNGAANGGIAAVADDLGAQRLWLAEPDACLTCIGMAGRLADPGEPFDTAFAATFTPKPRIWPPGAIVTPPIHPHCVIGSTRVAAPGQRVVTRDEARPVALSEAALGPVLREDAGELATSASTQAQRHVLGPDIRATTERDYVGDVIIIRTALGYELTCTPNHPIATRDGWVPAGELQLGGHVLSSTDGQWRQPAASPDVDDIPPTIQEVAQAPAVSLLTVPLSAEDFHGDAADGQVCVVRTYGLLVAGAHSEPAQHTGERALVRRDVKLLGLNARGALKKLFGSPLAAANRVVGRSSKAASLLRGCRGHANEHGRASVARFDAGVDERSADCGAADVEGFCERLLADAAEIALDEIVEIRTEPFRGHVYNLETPEGWFLGNGIVTHNCRCRITAWTGAAAGGTDLPGALRREAQRAVLKGFSLPSESGPARVRAAQQLLNRGVNAPASVQAYARAAVRRGRFTIRTVPTPPSRSRSTP